MRHVILRQVIEIFTDRSTDVFALQQRLSDLYHDEIVPVISQVFDACSDEEATLCIDQIIIDLGTIRDDELDHSASIESLMLSVARQITDQLKYGVSRRAASGVSMSSATHAFSAWLFYMEHGYIKWNVITPDDAWHRRILEAASVQQDSIDSLRALIKNNDCALRRIAFQHTPEFLTHLLETLTAQSQPMLSVFVKELSVLPALLTYQTNGLLAYTDTKQTREIWQAILLMTAVEPSYGWTTERIVLIYIQQTFKEQVLAKFVTLTSDVEDEHIRRTVPCIYALMPSIRNFFSPSETQHENQFFPEDDNGATETALSNFVDGRQIEPKEFPGSNDVVQEGISIINKDSVQERDLNEDGIFVRHAGLVILHPFISPFFKEVKLTENSHFIDTVSIHRAMLFLQYLALADDNFQEYEMVIAKLLCGFPLEEPFDTSLKLGDEDKAAAEELLKDVIGQWSILRNTSSSGLREGFLQRPGKYYVKNRQHYLHVENSSIDMLLDRLPWGLSMIKLPWMKHLLNVEWR